MFSHPFPNAFGIDISDLSIKIVQLRNASRHRKGASYEVVTFRSIELPPGLIVNGEIQEPEKVRKYIKHILGGKHGEEKKIKGLWCVASLPETQSFIKLITLPKPPTDIIEEDIITIAKKHIPFDEEDSFFDWQIIPHTSNANKSKTNILIAAIPQHIARNYTFLLESLGLGVISLEVESIAIARSLITAKKEYLNEARALLDLGATHSSLIIYDNDLIQFSISLPYSGELITTALSQRLQIERNEAEKKKKKYGLFYSKSDKQGKKTWSIIAEQTNILIKDIEKAIKFYYSHFPNSHKITKITMCGGASNMKRLDIILSEKLKIDCVHGHPWKNLAYHKQINITKQKSTGYATAIGLALRAADNPFFKRDII